jgi:thiol-disulfide isomerase/thioredoxin
MLAALLSLAACAGSVAPSASRPATPDASSIPGSSAPGSSSPGAALDQVWATADLVDVTTGETFRIADLAGKVLIVETMAIWCTSCRAQQASVEQALTQLPADRVVYILLDVDPNEDAASLDAYRSQHGYTGRYVIAPAEVARALAADFGNQFLSPPSTPIAVVSTDGMVTLTNFGKKSTDDIVALVRAAGA